MIRSIVDRIARLQFWWATRSLKLDRDFKYHEIEDPKSIGIQILTGKYAGVVYKYSDICVKEDRNGAFLDFETIILSTPSGVKLQTRKFAKLVSNIIRLILIDSTKADNESRELDSVELDEERTIREEDPPVRKKRVSNRKPRKEAVQRDL